MKQLNELLLKKIRHSCEHVLTMAMIELYPGLKMAMGPATDDGFYFDFEYDGKISEDDFPKIEKKMKHIIKQNLPFEKKTVSIKEAKSLFKDNRYKQEWIEEIKERGEEATVYYTGDTFVDLCSGPHVKSTKEIGAFKILSIAGAYWRGEEKNNMLTRIYGTAFASKDELNDYLFLLEEAKKRDHKILGKKLGLFSFSELVGPGLPLWSPKGTLLRDLLNDFVWELRKEKGYARVAIPHITKKDLYETSGHWDKFKDELFKIKSRDGHLFALKPMNCPHHTQIFASEHRSYREMPQRYAETTMVYRDEQTGELSGLSRVRCITQDDAHVFCRYNQIQQEIDSVWDIVQQFYSVFGFDLNVRLSLHDPDKMDAYLGDTKTWKDAEDSLREIAKTKVKHFTEEKGEAAFYGPKIDFIGKDSLKREWQVATVQLDFNMPKSFGLTCINEKGEKEDVVMLHVAIMGSIERFLTILIEHYGGAFPVWLSPVQVSVIPVSDKHLAYARKVYNKINDENIRVELSDEQKTVGNKIRQATLQKVPYMIIIGDQEIDDSTSDSLTISVRTREGEDLGSKSLQDFIVSLKERIENKQ